ncbi:pseudouridine synthase [Bartonella sp. A05]|uniref:pseudouridine synthase n=1 Tax=Bartonella sp. A05 TaxID=2967261 RepID=UPI0022A8EA4A|nr:pseudouridine synthase [Bartonella sp. A05]MCZ2203342.1 rRNA pseudouridine synthase [Bartonella sp. A05]
MNENNESERIAKRLARAGVASRRDAEMMIVAGRIVVNGTVVTTPAFNVTRSDVITVDGKLLPPIERTRLWLYHKPAGLVTTNRDPEGRPTVFDNVPEGMPRVLSVGRLDINTEGLLLLTNDGGLARVLELPITGWVRKYRVRAHGKIKQSELDSLKNGIAIDGIFYGSIEASIEREQGSNIWLSVALREGKNREIKNVLGALGLSVNRLIRVSYGPFHLSDLEVGAVRELKGRMLRDQLGERLIAQANADFDAPILKPFSNSIVVAEKQSSKKPILKDNGWIFSSESIAQRRKKGSVAERGRERLSTKLDEKFMRKDKNADGKAERFLLRSRRSNVWMAPGARPQSVRKKFYYNDDNHYENRSDFSGQRSFDREKERPKAVSLRRDWQESPLRGKQQEGSLRKERQEGQLRKDRYGGFDQKRGKTFESEARVIGKKDKFSKKATFSKRAEKVFKGDYDEHFLERKKKKVKPFDGNVKKSKPSSHRARTSKSLGETRAGYRR